MKKLTSNQLAKITGVLYLLLIPLGILGIIYIPETLIIPGDIKTTISNIIANETLFRISIISALLVQVVNILVVLFLYKLLKPVNKDIAALMVIFLLVAVPIAFINELNHVAVLQLLHSSNHKLVALFLDLHNGGIYIAQVFWGLWLLPMGYLVYKSVFLPKLIGILLMIGCFGYLADTSMYFLFPHLDITVSEFTFVGELIFPLWLLIKGVKNI